MSRQTEGMSPRINVPSLPSRERGGVDLMADILAWTHVDTLYEPGWYAGAWGLHFSARGERGFHVVTHGEVWLRVEDEDELVRLQVGDMVLVTVQHDLLSSPGQPVTPFIQGAAARMAVPRSRASVGLICGAYMLRDVETHPLFDQLPSVIVLRAGDREPGVEHVIAMMTDEAATQSTGMHAIMSRLVDVLLFYILRHWLARSCAAQTGWVAALRDPMLSRVLALLHDSPEYPWTIDVLAAQAHTSRATLIRRFSRTLDTSIMGYLREVRMQWARQLISSSQDGLDEIAVRVGYADAFSLSKAYKQWWGHAPSQARQGVR